MSAGTVIRKYGRLTLIWVVFGLVSILTYKLGNQVFAIRNIEVEGQGMKVVIDERRVPKNLIFFPAEMLRSQILKDNPLVAQVTFKKKLPHTLIIVAAPRVAIARLTAGGVPVGLDKNGVVLPEAQVGSAATPQLFLKISPVRIGEATTDRQILASLTFIYHTRSFLALTSIQAATDSAALLAKTSKLDIFFPQDGNIQTLAATLQTLLSGFRIKGTLPTKIDLRFDKPIVTF